MIETAYAAIERHALARVARRRGEAAAKALRPEGEAIGALAEVEQHLGDARIVSFDIFDTLLVRRGLAPEAIMRKTAGFARAIAGPRAGEAIFAARPFLADRMKAEMLAAGAGDEPLLEDVFAAALEGAGLSPTAARDAAQALIAFEVEVDAQGLVADPEAAPLLARLKARGLTVIATSDMYFRGAEIEEILRRAGLRAHFDHVFVSADLRWTKHGGRIFPLIAAEIDADPGAFLHIGDRADSDAQAPRAAGWRALHLVAREGVTETEARRIEESHTPSPGLRRRRVAAALGLHDEPLDEPERAARRLIGPACGLLAMCVLGQARVIGAERIYHLTRDGTMIRDVAAKARERFPHLAPEGLELRELAMSRAMGARLQLGGANGLSRLPDLASYLAKGEVSANTIARAFDLDETALRAEFGDASGAAFMALTEDPGRSGRLLNMLEEQRAAVVDHLSREGFLDAAPTIAVDIGYSGTFGVQLSDLFAERPTPGRRLDFHFLATSRYINGNYRKLHPSITLHPGVALDHRRRSSRWPGVNFAWLEPFLVDPERGKLERFEPSGAVFAESPLSRVERMRRASLRDAIVDGALAFIERYHAAPGDLEEAAALIQRRIVRFAGRPRRSEARMLGALAHQDGQSEVVLREATRAVNPLTLISEIGALREEDRWVQGSLARSRLSLVNRIMAGAPERDRRADPRTMWD